MKSVRFFFLKFGIIFGFYVIFKWNKNEIGVKQVMKTWTNQAGYPVVKIVRNYSNKSATITQRVFQLEPEEIEFEEELSVTGETGKDKR